jgi:hypothetical protein
MKRRLFNIATILSLMFCLILLGGWIRSYYYSDLLHFGRDGGNSHTLRSLLGRVHFVSNLSGGRVSSDTMYSSDRITAPYPMWNGGMSGYPPQPRWHFACIWQYYSKYHMGMWTGDKPWVTDYRLIVVPYRWLVVMAALLPAAWVVGAIRYRRRASKDRCVQCGYDLRATPDRCPECGREVATT